MGNMKTQKQDKEVVNNNKKSPFNNTCMVDYVLRVKEKRQLIVKLGLVSMDSNKSCHQIPSFFHGKFNSL